LFVGAATGHTDAMNSRRIPRRALATVALAASAAFLTACTSGGATVTSSSPAPTTPASAGATSGVGTTAGGAACDLLTASDVQTALSETVTASNAPSGAADGTTAQVQECILTTDGPPLAGSAATTLNALAATLAGGAGSGIDATKGGIAVIEATTSLPISASASPGSLPAGITAVPGVGQQAYVLASPAGGGLAVAEVTAGKVILVLDLEGKAVTTDQLTALLKAAVSHG